MLLLLSSLALAQEGVSCAEVQNMLKVGLPRDTVLKTINDDGMESQEIECLEEAGVDEAIIAVARGSEWFTGSLNAAEPEAAQQVVPAPTSSPTGSSTPLPMPQAFPVAQQPTYAQGCSDLELMLTLPDHGAAAALSASVGFGTGNFYAKRPLVGLTMAGVQVIGIGLLVGYLQQTQSDPLSADPALWQGGTAMLVGGRLVDTGLAWIGAQGTRTEMLDACGR